MDVGSQAVWICGPGLMLYCVPTAQCTRKETGKTDEFNPVMTTGMSVLTREKRRRATTEQRRDAIAAYLASEDVEGPHIEILLQLIDLYGLFHPAAPKAGLTARAIQQQAKAAAVRAWKRTWRC